MAFRTYIWSLYSQLLALKYENGNYFIHLYMYFIFSTDALVLSYSWHIGSDIVRNEVHVVKVSSGPTLTHTSLSHKLLTHSAEQRVRSTGFNHYGVGVALFYPVGYGDLYFIQQGGGVAPVSSNKGHEGTLCALQYVQQLRIWRSLLALFRSYSQFTERQDQIIVSTDTTANIKYSFLYSRTTRWSTVLLKWTESRESRRLLFRGRSSSQFHPNHPLNLQIHLVKENGVVHTK